MPILYHGTSHNDALNMRGAKELVQYIGELSHADFAYRFIEIETEGEDDADRLYDKHKMVLVGCHPFSKYVGIDDITPVPRIPQE